MMRNCYFVSRSNQKKSFKYFISFDCISLEGFFFTPFQIFGQVLKLLFWKLECLLRESNLDLYFLRKLGYTHIVISTSVFYKHQILYACVSYM